jgi:hypothetical protein
LWVGSGVAGWVCMMDNQLHDGFKKLNLKPAINFSPEDYDEFTNSGSGGPSGGEMREIKASKQGRRKGRDCIKKNLIR